MAQSVGRDRRAEGSGRLAVVRLALGAAGEDSGLSARLECAVAPRCRGDGGGQDCG